MQAITRQPQLAPVGALLHSERRRPEQSTPQWLMKRHLASFIADNEASSGAKLPRFVKDEIDVYQACAIQV